MGSYTELVIKVNFNSDLPENINNILLYMFDNKELTTTLPEHKFFNSKRWGRIGRCSSYYHHPKNVNSIELQEFSSVSKHKIEYLFSRSDLKNYGNEIELFIDWINPYLSNSVGNCIGWYWYEEESHPTLLYKK